MISHAVVTTPPAGIRLRQFTGIRVTTCNGARDGILGPWATSEWIDNTGGTPAGAIVMSASALSNGGQSFSVWLRPRSSPHRGMPPSGRPVSPRDPDTAPGRPLSWRSAHRGPRPGSGKPGRAGQSARR